MGEYKRFPVSVWSLFEELLSTKFTTIKGKLTELEVRMAKVNASSIADSLASTVYIDGIAFNGTSDVKHYGICATEAAEQVKIVACSGFTLSAGSHIIVKFTITNTAEEVQLNVNNTGAKYIQYKGSNISPSMIKQNDIIEFIYNGNQYEVVGGIGSTYTNFTASTNNSAGTAGLVPAPAIGDDSTKFLNAGGSWQVPPLASASASGYMSNTDKVNLDYLFHQTSTDYEVGDIVHVEGLPSNMYLECITAGTTDSISPDFEQIVIDSESEASDEEDTSE